MTVNDDLALENCDKEPIHITGSIQHFGCLIAFDRKTQEIVAISVNCEEYIGKAPEQCIGHTLDALFDRSVLHTVSNKLAYSTIESRREFVASISQPDKAIDVFVHAGPQFDYLELLDTSSASRAAQARIASLTSGMQKLETLEEVFDLAAQTVHIVANYDRTMFYRFLPDGSGEVVAECISGNMEPFLGLRYPAWDIPKQARKLYATTPIRAIADVDEPGVPLHFATGISAQDLDMSVAVLRSSSPIHCEYLRNMGVSSTMTIPVVVDNQLWGLITCHHNKPRIPTIDILDAAEVIGHIISFTIARLTRQKIADYQTFVADIRDNFISFQTRLKTEKQFLESAQKAAGEALQFDGIGLRSKVDWHTLGSAPSHFENTDTSAFRIPSDVADLIASNTASPALGQANGVQLGGHLEIPLITEPATSLVFFRKTIGSHVAWGGHPHKNIEEVDNKMRLSPRKSFARYIEENGETCDEWSASDILFAQSLQRECASSQSAAGRILQQKDNLRVLADELNHRVKNILALVKSLSTNARESTGSSGDYATSLEQRVFSLAASHDLLTRSEMEGVSLRALAAMELEPFLSEAQIEAALSGPDVTLSTDAVSMATLLIHELTSNAVKHGALSVSGGRVEVSWEVTGSEFFFRWREYGGPEITPPTRRGFGMELLEEAIPFEFNGKAELTFAPSGFAADYTMSAHPFLRKGAVVEESRARPYRNDVSAPENSKRGTALIVEDSYLLASEHAKILGRHGFCEVAKASNVGAALSILDESTPDFALLDINLRDEMSFAVADRLVDMGVPFAFVSGYGSAAKVPTKFAHAKLLKKPLTDDAVKTVLSQDIG